MHEPSDGVEVLAVVHYDPSLRRGRYSLGGKLAPEGYRLDGPPAAPGERVIMRKISNPKGLLPGIGEIAAILPPAGPAATARYLNFGLAGALLARLADRLSRNQHLSPATLSSGELGLRLLKIDPRHYPAASQGWAERAKAKAYRTALLASGLAADELDRICKAHPDNIGTLLADDPYQALRSKGLPHKIVDRLALSLGVPFHDARRQRAAVLAAAQEAERTTGSASSEHAIAELAAAKAGLPAIQIRSAINALVESGELRRRDSVGRPVLLTAAADDREEHTACALCRPRQTGAHSPQRHIKAAIASAQQAGRPLSPDQQTALRTLTSADVTILAGGPGTGKTTILRAFCDGAAAARPGTRILLASPTGRAARNLAAATGRPAKTLHRALGINPDTGKFLHGIDNPFDTDLVVVDEASMIGLDIAAPFLEAIPRYAKVVLVGDPDQLPPVGPGRLLTDMISTGVFPVARLTQVHRTATGSPLHLFSGAIRNGHLPPLPLFGDGRAPISHLNTAAGEAAVTGLITKVLPRLEAVGLDLHQDVQVIAPARNGPAGINALNLALQHALNPGPGEPGLPRRGDRVVQTTNDYDKGVYNGDVGTVTDTSPSGLTVDFDGLEIEYGAHEVRSSLNLAYCLSVHKSQGSEYRCPIIVHGDDDNARPLANRALLYTAATRMREKLVFVGPLDAFKRMAAAVEPPRPAPTLPYRFLRLHGDIAA